MGLVTVTDQHGNPPPTNDGCGQAERLFVQFVPLDGPAANGTPQTDRFTDNLGKIGTEGIPQTFGTQKFELRCNEANVNPNYGTARVNTSDLEHENVRITVQRSSSPPGPTPPITGNGTCDEWKKAVYAIFAKHGYTTVGPDNEGQGANQAPYLRATIAEIKALHPSPYVQWQYESAGTPPELRPRLFLPHNGPGPFARYADLGDWNTPLKWEHCQ